MLVLVLFGPLHDRSTRPASVALLGVWALAVGLRGILWHQIGDLEVDRAAGVVTAAARLDRDRTEALVSNVLLPLEIVGGVALAILADASWLPWLLCGFVVWRSFQIKMLWEPPFELATLRRRADRVDLIGFGFVNEFIERWLPVAALTALALDSPWWWPALVIHVLVFPSALRSFIARDLWLIPDAIERLLLSWGTRGEIRQVAQNRAARVRSGPSKSDLPSGRFVFVVCGPASHLRTLATAVRHLRPVTRSEIWVLTDSTRNSEPIDLTGIDHLVDVATPTAFDDHQASIWLKTSVHRHLPEGEWCYLDSDIIATVPGVDGVFAERRGPVAFASDVTIRENSVDRFSPWAMNCDCAGVGDEHSCSHLRDQLLVRFGLDVPGDWLHWNGGVFLFGPDSASFLDLWHERTITSFAWPEWKTRDQGTLIATVWSLGLQDLPRVSPEFNFIADLGNHDLCLDLARGWAHHPSGPWFDPKFLHLYTSPLDEPGWSLGRDVEAVVLRRSRVRVYRWERSVVAARAKHRVYSVRTRIRKVFVTDIPKVTNEIGQRVKFAWYRTHAPAGRVLNWVTWFFDPRRLSPTRIKQGIRRRRGLDVDPPQPTEVVERQASRTSS
ncbi:MAG: hypothetical protein U0Q22_02545 [Acidimicrobiales bacterium]